MLLYLLFAIILIESCVCDLEITDAGVLPLHEDDIAIIFYLTLRNSCDKNLEISVTMNQCCDQTRPEDNNCNLYLIGGYMGVLMKQETRNVTLIHPTLYIYNRRGTCSISVIYRSSRYEKVLTRNVDFNTNFSDEEQVLCSSYDLDPTNNCNPVDCVIKYYGDKSYFNPTTKECECVTTCLNDPTRDPSEKIGYSWLTNECINLNNTINKYDLEFLENNQADSSDNSVVMTNAICHHGDLDSNGECMCSGTWRTSLFEDDVYEPSLFQYHMCNIEPGGWNCVNRNRIEATALIIGILSFTIATKLLVLMCILHWCYWHFKKNKETIICTENPDEFEKSLIMSEYSKDSDSRCICSDLKKQRYSSLLKENTDVTYYPGGKDCKLQCSIKSETVRKCPDYSIRTSNTTSSSTAISFPTDSDQYTETTDYEIDFSGGEEEECPCPNVSQNDQEDLRNIESDEKIIKGEKEPTRTRRLSFDRSVEGEEEDSKEEQVKHEEIEISSDKLSG